MSLTHRPPKFLVNLLERLLPSEWHEIGPGDFEEEYSDRVTNQGHVVAVAWYGLQIIFSTSFFVFDSFYRRFVMLKTYLLITLRNMRKNKISSFINVFGLAVGLACCIVIMLFVHHELSFDRFHENGNRIYRLILKSTRSGEESRQSVFILETGNQLVEEYPEILETLRMERHAGFVVEYEEKRLTTNPHFADPNLFNFLTFPLVQGDKNTVLNDTNSIVISQSFSKKLFGRQSPIGKILTLYSMDTQYDFKVTGLMLDIPLNSHIKFDIVVPFKHYEQQQLAAKQDLNRLMCTTYLLLNKHADPQVIEAKLPDFVRKHYGNKYAETRSLHFQKLTDIHLRSDFDSIVSINVNSTQWSIFYPLALIAFLILLIASINFVNLSIARASRRAKEVGIRQAIGASRFQLLIQFLAETVILSFISLLVGLGLASMILPLFNSIMRQELSLDLGANLPFFCVLLGFTFLVGILSGLYPSLFLASFRPVECLKGEVKGGTKTGHFIRKGLVILQFTVSVVFIIGTLMILRQLNYVKKLDLGFSKENIIRISIFKDSNLKKKPLLIKQELMKNPNITRVILSSSSPGSYAGWPRPFYRLEAPDETLEMNEICVGKEHFDFFGIKFVQGGNFSEGNPEHSSSEVIINETAARMFGWDNPIGQIIRCDRLKERIGVNEPFKIIGVVRDFHNATLHEAIKPSVYYYWPDTANSSILMRIQPENIQETLAWLQKKWGDLPTHIPFRHVFIDEGLEEGFYRNDRKIGQTYTFGSLISITLACMGIFGMAAFTVERRRKEIGIRRVFGASERRVFWLLSRDFTYLVLIANLIAWPIGYYVCRRWLDNFAFRANINWWIFILATGLVLSVSVLTVGYHTSKTATANPADILRCE